MAKILSKTPNFDSNFDKNAKHTQTRGMDSPKLRLVDRITPEQIDRLRRRETTVRALAAELGVAETWLSRNFPGRKIGKVPPLVAAAKIQKRALTASRWDYRLAIAKQVKDGQLTIKQGAKTAHCTVRTMYRYINRV